MPYEFFIRQNDTKPSLLVTLVKDIEGTPHDLIGGTTVVFSMSTAIGGTQKLKDKAVNIVSPSLGRVRYDWGVGDTNTIGIYYGEFEVTFPDGSILTLPEKNSDGTGGYIIIEIFGEVA